MTDTTKELGVAIFASIVGGVAGYFVGKKTHRVLGTATGLGVGLSVGALVAPVVVKK